MPRVLKVRELSEEEAKQVRQLARSRTEQARRVQRANIILLSHAGKEVPQISEALKLSQISVRRWIKRFNSTSAGPQGLQALVDEPRCGRPPTYTQEQVSEVIATALTSPQVVSAQQNLDPPLPFGAWTLDRLAAYLSEHRNIPISRDRISVLLRREGLRWRTQERWFSEQARLAGKEGKADPLYAEKRGP
jgi:transposase